MILLVHRFISQVLVVDILLALFFRSLNTFFQTLLYSVRWLSSFDARLCFTPS